MCGGPLVLMAMLRKIKEKGRGGENQVIANSMKELSFSSCSPIEALQFSVFPCSAEEGRSGSRGSCIPQAGFLAYLASVQTPAPHSLPCGHRAGLTVGPLGLFL